MRSAAPTFRRSLNSRLAWLSVCRSWVSEATVSMRLCWLSSSLIPAILWNIQVKGRAAKNAPSSPSRELSRAVAVPASRRSTVSRILSADGTVVAISSTPLALRPISRPYRVPVRPSITRKNGKCGGYGSYTIL